MLIYKIIYWAGVIIEVIIRAPYQKMAKANQAAKRHVTTTEMAVLFLLLLGSGILPLVYTFTPWLGFADYHLPPWMGWLGILVECAALYLFYRSHNDLKDNWSPSLEIYQEHTLVTEGIYRFIRHPMYASQWLMVIAQILLLQNWLAGPTGLIVFIPFYFLRFPAEEKMMLDTFGDEYRAYMQRTGRVIPKLGRPAAENR